MAKFPKKLLEKLARRKTSGSFRKLLFTENMVDFSSNDYLGMANCREVWDKTQVFLNERNIKYNGATGSRLLSGNNNLIEELEDYLAMFHNAQSALLFNSGYDANLGFFSSVPQRDDIVIYDELIHASIRDGIQMGRAKSYKFKHNDLDDLALLAERFRDSDLKQQIYVVTESIFSMDGDRPDLVQFVNYCQSRGIHLVVDEAHAVGIYGDGKGLLNELTLEREIFARIITFGKAMGCHGAAVLGSGELKDYLVNYARSFIYTTALPPHSVATIMASYMQLRHEGQGKRKRLFENINYFENRCTEVGLKAYFSGNGSAIQLAMIPDKEKVKRIAQRLGESGYDVRPILSPTVPEGKERLRFCIHSFNSKKEIDQVLFLLKSQLDQ